jgi:formamidopyrimidine-DNA glycosylase
MPELPEVETVRRGLNGLIVGLRVRSVANDNPKSFPNATGEVNAFLLGASITAVRRRAKVLLIDLSSEHTLVIHLKMTGQLVFVNKNVAESREKKVESEERFGAGHPNDSLISELPDRSTRVIIEFTDGSHLYFNDQRKFGWVKLYPTIEVPNIDFMKRVGPEPLEDELTHKDFIQRIRRRNGTTVKAALLDQTVIAGIGNIYADEALWGAHIHPARRVRDVSDAELNILLDEVRFVLRLSIEKGGSTDRNYVNAEGKRGSYIDFARVFRRENLPCPRHPDVLIEKSRVAGRGTHICPVCQPQ